MNPTQDTMIICGSWAKAKGREVKNSHVAKCLATDGFGNTRQAGLAPRASQQKLHQGMDIKENRAMHQATVKQISVSRIVQDGRREDTKQLFFDDAAWVITSPMVNVTQRLFDEARRNRPEAMFASKSTPTEPIEGDVVPLTISREQTVLRRVQRAVANQRSFGNNIVWGSKPF